MNWLNLSTSVLDSPEVVGAEPTDRATWLFLLRFCVGQENGGRISGCADWLDRKWQQLCKVTRQETQQATELWRWDGSDLVVAFYPSEKEEEVRRLRVLGGAKTQAKASAARENGKHGGRPKVNNPTETQQETHGKPIEENRIEENRIEEKIDAPRATVISESRPVEKPAGAPEMDEVFAFARENAVESDCAEKWYWTHDSENWQDKWGRPLANWRSSLRGYWKTWAENNRREISRRGPAQRPIPQVDPATLNGGVL